MTLVTMANADAIYGYTTATTRSDLALSFTRLKLKALQESHSHEDLLAFLSLIQANEVDILPLVWYPALSLGQGGFATVNESLVNQHVSFAFKRLKFQEEDGQEERQSLRSSMVEVSILKHHAIQRHPNIIDLEGICWEVNPLNPYISPVLVFETAKHGNLLDYRDSKAWVNLTLKVKVAIWRQIAGAVYALHAASQYSQLMSTSQ